MTTVDRPAASFPYSPYPGTIPPWSYCIQDGQVRRLQPGTQDYLLDDGQALAEWLSEHGGNHVPLLTYGSNACPGRLVQKFPDIRGSGFVLLKGILHGAVRVWSLNKSRSGAVPLTLAGAPNGVDRGHLLLIPADHADVLDATEGRGGPFYELARLDNCSLALTNGTRWASPVAYLGHQERGPLLHHGRTVGPAQADQERAQDLVLTRAEQGDSGDCFLPARSPIATSVRLQDAIGTHQDQALMRWLKPPVTH